MLREAKLEAERIIYATRAALDSDADLLSEGERGQIETLLSDMEGLSESAHPAVIHTAVEALAKGTETFAARRMNRNIQQALAGKYIDEII
jgi:molecular chaperone HscA